MQLSVIATTLLTIFATSPNLCEEPYLDAMGTPCIDSIGQTLSRYCQWTGPDVPKFDSDVCCAIEADGASCWMPDALGLCASGSKYYCEYAEPVLGGGVVCYQPFDDACDHGHCMDIDEPELPPDAQANLICCSSYGACVPIVNIEIWDCEEDGHTVQYCFNGTCNVDGTVTCYD